MLESRFSSINDLGFVDVGAGNNAVAINTDLNDALYNDGLINVGAFEFNTEGNTVVIADFDGYLDPSNPLSGLVGTQINGKDVWSAYQTAQHIARYQTTWADLRDGSVATDLNVTYNFVLGTTNPTGVSLDFGPGQMEMTRLVYQYISEITPMTFTEIVTETATVTADLHLVNQDTSAGGGAANLPNEGNGFVGVGGRGSTTLHYQYGSYMQHLLFHEGAGHALGLVHPGPYNGGGHSYLGDADHFNDSRQYSQMSYWGPGNTGATFSGRSTMGLHDILALQIEYGANMSSRTGNDTYGFNASDAGGVYDFTTGVAGLAFSIWDAAGNDTLDFSGSTSATQIDLRDGAFSSANGQVHNVSIAYGAVIENAVGSLLDDAILGNTANNVLRGGAGHDVMRGGVDMVPDFAIDPRHFTGIEINRDPLVRDQYLQVDNIQSFSGQAFTIEMMVEVIRIPNNGIQLVSYAVPGSADEFRIASPGNGGNLQVYINGVVYNTTIPTETIVDGQPHRLSVSWDSTTGNLNTYIDGILADSGVHQAGAPLAIGGTLIFGQDQDSVGGGLQAQQVLQGTIGDIRIFDHVQTQTQINDNRFTTLTGNEAGLLNNWQVQAGDTTTVTDVAVANPSVNLTDLLPGSFTVTQSSSYNASSGADLVLDNNTGTFNHTQNSGNEWLLLSFDQPRDITTVSFQNRPTWGNRLNGATVSVLDDQGNALYTSAPITGAIDGEVFSFSFPSTLTASSVRIDQTQNFLHIAELNVFGPASAGVAVDPALLNTDLSIHSGASGTLATVHNTAPVVDTSPDNDTLYGEQGNDVLRGGWGDDTLYGHGGNTALDSPFAATTGIVLNQNGASNQYLEIANYNGIAGAANSIQFTIEMLVESLSSGYSPLLSYAHYARSNGFLVEIGTSGNFLIHNYGGVLDTGISAAGLTDGDIHRFSLSWDGTSAAGQFVIYIDGAEVGRGSHPRQNWQINGNGTLIFGQEQDSIGGGFQTSQILDGSISDIRVYNDIRTAQEITNNAFSSLDTAGLGDANLVNNWQVDSNSITNQAVADALGGTALTLNGFSAPTQVSLTSAIEAIDLNSNRATNQSLSIDSTSALSGGAFTLEFMVELGASFNSRSTLATYGPNYAMELEFRGGTTLQLSLPGAGFFDTGITLTALQAAGAHRISISWDSATGTIAAYLDGVVQNSGVHGLGAILATGGRLAFGQDLNSGGAIANAGDDISVGDIRIFNDVRTAAEILANVTTPLASPTTEQGLVSNWQVDGTSIANGTIVDVTGGASLMISGESAPSTTQVGNWDDDILMGGAGNDQLYGGAGDDILEGGTGNDTLDGGSGIDTASYDTDTLGVRVSLAGQNATGRAGIDTLTSIENAIGGSGNDTLIGSIIDNQLEGGAGNDVLLDLSGGNDTLMGGLGNDQLQGGAGSDINDGGDGIDEARYNTSDAAVTVNLGNGTASGGHATGDSFISIENVVGSTYDDTITGDTGANRLEGYLGDDMLDGGLGADVLFGDLGFDTASYASSAVGVDVGIFRIGTGGDSDGDTLLGIESIIGSSFADTLVGTGLYDTSLFGGDGDDLLFDYGGNATLDGGAGNDTLIGSLGADHFIGGADTDVVRYANAIGAVTVNLAANTGSGADAQGDTFDGIENLAGSIFNDSLTGDAGVNRLEGGRGQDHLNGGLGNDLLIGGADADYFIYDTTSWGNDIIIDFSDGSDLIDLTGSGLTFADFTEVATAAGMRLDYNDGTTTHTIAILNLTTADIDATDFLF